MKYKVKITPPFGVPVTFIIDNYNPEQFKILAIGTGFSWSNYKDALISLSFNPLINPGGGLGVPVLDARSIYTRLFIRFR